MKIIRKLKKHNIAVRILTNATLLDDKQINELAKIFNPYTDSVSISLDAVKNGTLKKIRHTDCFDKIITNINKLVLKNKL